MSITDWPGYGLPGALLLGLLLCNLASAFNWRPTAKRDWGDLWGFISGLLSLPLITWFFLADPAAMARWVTGGILLFTVCALVVQYARLWKTAKNS